MLRVLNGMDSIKCEDEQCVKIGNSLRWKVAYFSLNEDCLVIVDHCGEVELPLYMRMVILPLKKETGK